MTEHERAKTPWWYWAVGALFVFLGIMGVVQWVPYYVVDLSTLAQENPVRWQLWSAAPVWAEVGYGAGNLGMFIGSLGFVLRRGWSQWFFAAAGLGLLLHRVWLLVFSGLTDLLPDFGPVALFVAILFDACAIVLVRSGVRRGFVT